ncbi:FAD-dependent oxidoreductase [Maribellus sp. YY47]|uniref:FAD-dependent oxidoreductase n=1 Tax=Maribellus sp. YY47 TaxID=2929486 RepID=UPI002001D1B3|nr:FAD-dependent oxidoreductase [Maribellus sp. YY47]MCK3683908.1 FAD-dependent oxidoreductase [Maribellus sp. YY47]
MRTFATLLVIMLFSGTVRSQSAETILIEAESFSNTGGWVVDQQFTHLVGSSYLLAHGMGTPVANASTKLKLPASGAYRIWVRTKDWVPENEQTPGLFKLKVNNVQLEQTFGINQDWNWVDGGTQNLSGDSIFVELVDLTGFDGRCDAIILTTDLDFIPPNQKEELDSWCRQIHNLPDSPPLAGTYDVVIVGGGMAGSSAALAAALEGCSVVLIQDRPVLGGNASGEVRVHTIGMSGYRIVDEINTGHYVNGSPLAAQSTENRHRIIESEPKITLMLSTRAFRVNTTGRIVNSIDVKHIASGEESRIKGNQFIDCTGDGWIGYWAGNRFMMGREAADEFDESLAPQTADNKMMGSTLLFLSKNDSVVQPFPEVPWAMDVAKDYSAAQNEWFWEYGIGLNPFADAEHIRDHLLRAIYGAFYNEKQKPGNENLKLDWVAHIMGKRESRRLVGEHILTEKDVRNSVDFEDAVVVEEREIDLHLPNSETYDFLTKAYFTQINRYHVPFRSFIAADFENLMMAGRCLSASHVGLGSPRVMNTVGQMGVATGCAAALCKKYNTTPRDVHENYLDELKQMVGIDQSIPDGGMIYDNADFGVDVYGDWVNSTYNNTYYGSNYMHDNDEGKGEKSVVFHLNIQESGNYTVYTRYTSGENRASNTPYDILHADSLTRVLVNQQNYDGVWLNLGSYYFDASKESKVTISPENTDGHVIVDAISLVKEIVTGTSDIYEKQTGIRSVCANNTEVRFYIDALDGKGNLEIFNLQGEKMAFIETHFLKGNQLVTWHYNAQSMSDKVLLARFTQGELSASMKFFIK